MGIRAARRRWAALLALGTLGGAPRGVAAPTGEAPVFHVHIPSASIARAVRGTLKNAADRFSTEGCTALLSTFSDASGVTLSRRLEELGETPRGYLSLLLFYDGSRVPACAARETLAVTVPGSRAVFVCPDSFVKTAMHDPLLAQAMLIHEALHTLGLGENPPSSREITARVLSSCRQPRGEAADR